MPRGMYRRRPAPPPQPGTMWTPPLGDVDTFTAEEYRTGRDAGQARPHPHAAEACDRGPHD